MLSYVVSLNTQKLILWIRCYYPHLAYKETQAKEVKGLAQMTEPVFEHRSVYLQKSGSFLYHAALIACEEKE